MAPDVKDGDAPLGTYLVDTQMLGNGCRLPNRLLTTG